MKTFRRGAVILLGLLVAACASAQTPGGGEDAGHPPGPGEPDAAGEPDAGEPQPDTPDADGVTDPDAASSGGTPDAGPTGACNLVTGAGCSGATPACDLGAANAHVCRAVLAQGMNTSTCNDATSCAIGYSCIGASATQSSCLHYCGGDADCGGGAGALCAITLVDGNNAQIPGVTLCSQACGPLDASGCPATWGCRLGREPTGAMRALTTCEPSGTGGRNAVCSSSADCQAGFQCFCTDAMCTPALQQCKKLCNATDNLGCPSGTACQGLMGVVIGGKAWGACP